MITFLPERIVGAMVESQNGSTRSKVVCRRHITHSEVQIE